MGRARTGAYNSRVLRSLILAPILFLCSCSRPAATTSDAGKAARITQFYAREPALPKGEKILLCYGVENAKTVRIDPPVDKVWPALSRCFDVAPSTPTTYALPAEGEDGQPVTKSVTVQIGSALPKIIEVVVNSLSVHAGEQVSVCCSIIDLVMPIQRLVQFGVLARITVAGLLVVCNGMQKRQALQAASLGARGNLLVSDVTILDIENRRFTQHQDILISDGRISRIGPGIVANDTHRRRIDGRQLLALPGFVNTHTHLWQHIAKGEAPNAQLQQWVRGVYRYAHYLTQEEVYAVTCAAAREALMSGITTVVDFSSLNFNDYALPATIRALRDSHVRGAVVWWHPAAFLPPAAKERELTRLRKLAEPPVEVWMGFGPLSFFSLATVYDGINLAKRLGLRLTEHTMENVQEQRDLYDAVFKYLEVFGPRLTAADRMVLEGVVHQGRPTEPDLLANIQRLSSRLAPEVSHLFSGVPSETASPVPLLEYLGAMQDFVAIHGVWPNANDISAFARHDVCVSYNPESNMYLSSGIAPVVDYLDKGVCVSLGTDGAASNDRIDMFSAMRTAIHLQHIDRLDPGKTKVLDPWAVLRMATIEGARALRQEDRIGSLGVGKAADIVLLSCDQLGLSPLDFDRNGASLLVNSATPTTIVKVIAGGEIVFDRIHKDLVEPVAARQLTDIAIRVRKRILEGRTWRESITFPKAEKTWLRYRSVRKPDRVDLTMTNMSAQSACFVLAFSGTTFGGTVPQFLTSLARDRFPSNTPPRWEQTTFELERGRSIHVSKEPGLSEYQISGKGDVRSRIGVDAEQIYLSQCE